MSEHIWIPLNCFQENINCKVALMVLNRPLAVRTPLFKVLWSKAIYRATVDGGTNSLYKDRESDRENFIPDVISGDFDSIESHVMEYYKQKGSEIIHTPDQNATDFTKALRILIEKIDDKQVDGIIVLGAFGGRLDQIFANIDTLFQADKLTRIPVVLFSHDSFAFLLPRGKHEIQIDTKGIGDWCGLIPISGPCHHVTTTGLKWNLKNQCLRFGETISTSNCLDKEYRGAVTVENDQPLLCTMGFCPEKINCIEDLVLPKS